MYRDLVTVCGIGERGVSTTMDRKPAGSALANTTTVDARLPRVIHRCSDRLREHHFRETSETVELDPIMMRLALLLSPALVSFGQAFYLPGVNPRSFAEGELYVTVWRRIDQN
jgi:hypothetical protein